MSDLLLGEQGKAELLAVSSVAGVVSRYWEPKMEADVTMGSQNQPETPDLGIS